MDQYRINHALAIYQYLDYPWISCWLGGINDGLAMDECGGGLATGHGSSFFFTNHVSSQMLIHSDKLSKMLVLDNKYKNESTQETNMALSLMAAICKACLCGLRF